MADIKKIKEELDKLTVLEAAELVAMLEEEWGVSAAAPVAVAAVVVRQAVDRDFFVEIEDERLGAERAVDNVVGVRRGFSTKRCIVSCDARGTDSIVLVAKKCSA